MKKLTSLFCLLALSANTVAASIAIVGGKVHTMGDKGTLDSATVLMKDGKIVDVIEGAFIPDGYERIDATGKVVTPGFIGAYTSLGLVEVSSSSGTVDASVKPVAVSTTGAAYDVSYAINTDSSLLAISRLEGVTSAASTITSSEQLFSGLGSVITLSQGGNSVLKPRAFMAVNVANRGADHNGESRAALWVTLENAVNEAKSAATNLSANDEWHGVSSRADVVALKRVIAGDIPLLMMADRAADIRQIIQFKQRHPSIKVVLLHGIEAWRVADELAKADIPVIVNPEYNLPGSFEQLGATLANAGRLEKAGVKVAIGMDTHNIRLMAQHAGNAVANGLSYEQGLASVTSNVAAIFHMEDAIGTLNQNARADVVIWSGDPLEVTQAAEAVFIEGEAMDMTSRQTKLRDRYQSFYEKGQNKTSQYVRP